MPKIGDKDATTGKTYQGRIYCWFAAGTTVFGNMERFKGLEGQTSRAKAAPEKDGRFETENSVYELVGAPVGYSHQVDDGYAVRYANGPWLLAVDRCIRDQCWRAGTAVYPFTSYDYGLASDDTRATGLEHVSVTEDPAGGTPAFTVPKCTLRPAPWLANKD